MPVTGTIVRLAGSDPLPFSMVDYGRVHVKGGYVYRSVFHIDGAPVISDCPISPAEETTLQHRLQHDKAVLEAAGYEIHSVELRT